MSIWQQRHANGLVTDVTLPDANTLQYSYDATWNRRDSFTDERGNIFASTIDNANGHLLDTSTDVTDFDTNVATPTTEYVYNATTGLLETITDPARTRRRRSQSTRRRGPAYDAKPASHARLFKSKLTQLSQDRVILDKSAGAA